ncbi:MAG: hypothetical protein Q9188_001682 [Gyalolechia gomerana]
MGDYGDDDLEQAREPPHGTTPLQADPLGPMDGGDKVLNIPVWQNYKHGEDDELRGIQPESLATIIPLKDERAREDEVELLLPGPKLTRRASTFPRLPFGRAVSPSYAIIDILRGLALALNTRPHPDNILCWDSRYATKKPKLDSCTSIIAHQIVTPPFNTGPITFSRRSIGASDYRVPHSWRTGPGGCVIAIDIPELPSWPIEYVESSLVDVKKAAIELAESCVARNAKLGGSY